jgi:predicted Zn-dependent peptidase
MELKQKGITSEEFERSRTYSKAMVAINAENPMSRMIRNAQNQLILDQPITVAESIANYDRLTIDQVNQATEQLQPDKYSAAVIGSAKPVEESMKKLSRDGNIILRY